MTLERRIATVFRLDDAAWMRHANPWSVWTRFAALPFLVAALWSRLWVGWWFIFPTAAAVLWMWINPRLFPPPTTTKSWASKAVLGERVWLNRDRIPVPERHRVMPNLLSAAAAVGGVVTIYGCVALLVWPTLLGLTVVYFGKLWFIDRMVWLYEDTKDAVPEYRSWLY